MPVTEAQFWFLSSLHSFLCFFFYNTSSKWLGIWDSAFKNRELNTNNTVLKWNPVCYEKQWQCHILLFKKESAYFELYG